MSSSKTSSCHHIQPNGRFCQSPALRDDHFCYFHRSSRERLKRQQRNARYQVPLELPVLEDAATIQLAIGDVLNALLLNRIDRKTASTLLYGLQMAAGLERRTSFSCSRYHDDRVANYTEWERESLEDEIVEEISGEEASRAEEAEVMAAHADAAQSAKRAARAAGAPHPRPEVANAADHPDADKKTLSELPVKKPAQGVTHEEFWNVVGAMAARNARVAAVKAGRRFKAEAKDAAPPAKS